MAVVKKKKRNSRAAALAAEINDTLKLENPIRLGSDPYFTITRVPTGSLVMDRITGGGWALGRHYELFGDESVGKFHSLSHDGSRAATRRGMRDGRSGAQFRQRTL
jgi:RecA/RadA recombinase